MWHDVFHLQVSLGEKVLRSVLVYLFLLIAFRFAGKRELGQANTLDLVVLLLVANAVQNGIIGNDVSVTGAVVGAVVLFLLNSLFARLTFRLPRFSALLEGEPTELIEDGKVIPRALRRELISLPELRANRAPARLLRSRRGPLRDPRNQRSRDDVPRGRALPLPPAIPARTANRQTPPRPRRRNLNQPKWRHDQHLAALPRTP